MDIIAFQNSLYKEERKREDSKEIRKETLRSTHFCKSKGKSKVGMLKQMGIKAPKVNDYSEEDMKFIVAAHKACLKNKKAIKKMLKDEKYAKEVRVKEWNRRNTRLIKNEHPLFPIRDYVLDTNKDGKLVKKYPFVSKREKEQVREFYKDPTIYSEE